MLCLWPSSFISQSSSPLCPTLSSKYTLCFCASAHSALWPECPSSNHPCSQSSPGPFLSPSSTAGFLCYSPSCSEATVAHLDSGARQGRKLVGSFPEAQGSSLVRKVAEGPGSNHDRGPQWSYSRTLKPGSWFKSRLRPHFSVPLFSHSYNPDKIVLSS